MFKLYISQDLTPNEEQGLLDQITAMNTKLHLLEQANKIEADMEAESQKKHRETPVVDSPPDPEEIGRQLREEKNLRMLENQTRTCVQKMMENSGISGVKDTLCNFEGNVINKKLVLLYLC